MSSIKNIKPIKRSRAWFGGKQPWKYRLTYPFNVFISYVRYYVFRQSRVSYLGKAFYYDAKVTPLGLMLYPEEVGLILDNIQGELKYVLDIGANIGQFAVTLSELSPQTTIHSFEPLPSTYQLLRENVVAINNITTYQLGVGKKGNHSMFYLPSRSVNASFIKNNANYRLKDQRSKRTTVEITDTVSASTQRKKYDLIKVDVEGYEYQTIQNLKDIQTKYLYIEVTGSGREKRYKHSALFNEIQKSFGDFDIVYITRASKSKFETLLSFSAS